MNAKAKKTVKIVLDVLLWIFLALALFMTILAFTAQASSAGYPKIGNKCWLFVQTDSMEGPDGFYVGDLIIGRVLTGEEKQNLQKGDVITFFKDLDGDGTKELNTHRIVVVNPDGTYRTRGDRKITDAGHELADNEGLDPYTLYATDIEAIWTGKRIPFIGAFIGFLQSQLGFGLCIVLPLLAFFVYEIFVMISTINKIKNKDKRQITKEDEELIKQRAIEEYLARQAQQDNSQNGETNNQ